MRIYIAETEHGIEGLGEGGKVSRQLDPPMVPAVQKVIRARPSYVISKLDTQLFLFRPHDIHVFTRRCHLPPPTLEQHTDPLVVTAALASGVTKIVCVSSIESC